VRKLLVGQCHENNIYQSVDPTQYLEVDFEAEVIKALSCLLPDYFCGVFAGAFTLEDERRVADLALIHKSFSHWFVVEVELAGHSFERHVLPQIRCFRYGEPHSSCVTSLTRGFKGMSREQAESLLHYVPRQVVVVGNIPDPEWTKALHAVDVQHLTVTVFRNRNGDCVHEVEGLLTIRSESLGFSTFSATDNSLRISKSSGLDVGQIQITDQFGNASLWNVQEVSGVLWISKENGPALLSNGSYVQLLKNFNGEIYLRPSESRNKLIMKS
jgi:hypothetical protein